MWIRVDTDGGQGRGDFGFEVDEGGMVVVREVVK